MIFFGHVGITVGVVQAVNNASGRKVDLRKAAVLAIAPDLIDKPVGLLYPIALGNHTRLWGHSILFTLLVLAVFYRFKDRFIYPGILTGAYFGHMILDRIWINDMYAFLWPFEPYPGPLSIPVFTRWQAAIFQPWSIFGEVTGLSIILFLYAHYKVYRPGKLREFLATGHL